VDRTTEVMCDQRVIQAKPYGLAQQPEHFWQIRYTDPEPGTKRVFITNNTALPALSIRALYKSRWQVELFFKCSKQHLRIKHFLGNSENAVSTQIWCAVATYVLIAIVKKGLKLPTSLYTLLQILSVSVFEKTQLWRALWAEHDAQETPNAAKQIILYDI
jgi:IS4 transposase